METHSLGDHLRREREARGVSLDAVSAATRIPIRTLQAMETDQWNRLPGGIFNRGFVRSVGAFLGLDADSLVAQYVAATHDGPQQRLLDPEPRPVWPVVVWVAAGALALAALIVGSWAAYRYFRAHATVAAPTRHAALIRQPKPSATIPASPVSKH